MAERQAMNREQRLAETFVELADTLVDDLTSSTLFRSWRPAMSNCSRGAAGIMPAAMAGSLFAPQAIAAGFRSANALPLGLRS
jgi:hypothetical protein